MKVACRHVVAIAWSGFIFGAIGACDEAPRRCEPLALDEGVLEGFAAPEVFGLQGAVLRVVGTGSSLERGLFEAAELEQVLVDPEPHRRGEHVMWLATQSASCDPVFVPLVRAGELASFEQARIGPPLPDRRFGALIVSSDVSYGEAGDGAWEGVVEALGFSGRVMSGPQVEDVEAALVATLGEVAPGGILVLVMAGPGTAAGPGLVLTRRDGTTNAVSFDLIRRTLEAEGGHLGLVVWMLDTSHAADVRIPSTPPTMLVRASDRFAVNAPRLSRDGPSALGAAMLTQVEGERARRCIDDRPLADLGDVGEVADVLVAAASGVRLAMVRARWEALGRPAIERMVAAGELTPQRRDALAMTLERQVPREVVIAAQDVPSPDACEVDEDCAGRAGCLIGGPDGCERWACEAGLCVRRDRSGGACDDGNSCTEGDACRGTSCVGELVQCDDGNVCTDEACEPGRGCVATARVGAACDDGDPCTEGEQCGASGLCIGSALSCDDGDPCTVDTCEPASEGVAGGCRFEAVEGLACDDGDTCTLGDVCRGRVCLGARLPCGDNNPCTADSCDSGSGGCRYVSVADLVGCDDGDPCTRLSRCMSGQCVGVTETCDDGIACTFDRCGVDGGCQHLPAPGTCVSPTPGEGCIAVGERPAGASCLMCAQTGVLVGVDDGSSCGDGGVAGECSESRCEGGRCVTRVEAESCVGPDGVCVAAGEALTECLECIGGGVARPFAAGSVCGGPAECGVGSCDAGGNCVVADPRPCCATRVLACGEPWVIGHDDVAGLGSRVDRWSCGEGLYEGAERWVEVVAPCNGVMRITVDAAGPGGEEPGGDGGPDVGGVAVVALGADACVAGLDRAGSGAGAPYPCQALATSHDAVTIGAGQVVRAAIEVPGQARVDGLSWVVSTSCLCD